MTRRPLGPVAIGAALAAAACGGSLDAGRDVPHGLLPVDERNPAILINDQWSDNWSGEHAVLLANSGGLKLAGIIAAASSYWPVASDNAAGWSRLVTAARDSGLKHIPDVTMSPGEPLTRPADGQIDNTPPNNSEGAKVIVDLSRRLSRPGRPVVVLACVPLTTVADAYLIDHSVADRVVVVAALGELGSPNAAMNGPNGDLDAWSDWIVAQKFTYVQVSAYYDQTSDVAASDVASLPKNAFGTWMANKQADIYDIPNASDQIAVLSVALSTLPSRFVTAVQRSSPDITVAFDSMQGPPLVPDANGNAWVVTQIAPPLAKSRLWDMLLDPSTFSP